VFDERHALAVDGIDQILSFRGTGTAGDQAPDFLGLGGVEKDPERVGALAKK